MNGALALTWNGPVASAANTHHVVPTRFGDQTAPSAGSSVSVVEPCSTSDCVVPYASVVALAWSSWGGGAANGVITATAPDSNSIRWTHWKTYVPSNEARNTASVPSDGC